MTAPLSPSLAGGGPLPTAPGPARVQVVIVSYEAREDLLACLDSLARHARLAIEVTVVDNASRDGSVAAVRARHPGIRVLPNPENAGFAAACNRGWRSGDAPLVFFLNPDAEVTAGAIETLVSRLDARADVAIVGPLTRNVDGSVQVSTGPDLSPASEIAQRRLVRGVAKGDPAAVAEAARRHAREHEPAWVSGAALVVRRSALERVGGFDEGFFLYEEDADLCRRVRAAAGRVLFTPAAEVRHRLGRSMAREPSRARLEYHRSHLRYYRKHNGAAAVVLLRAAIVLRALATLGRRDTAEARMLLRVALRAG